LQEVFLPKINSIITGNNVPDDPASKQLVAFGEIHVVLL
jgi:hypothetical protein